MRPILVLVDFFTSRLFVHNVLLISWLKTHVDYSRFCLIWLDHVVLFHYCHCCYNEVRVDYIMQQSFKTKVAFTFHTAFTHKAWNRIYILLSKWFFSASVDWSTLSVCKTLSYNIYTTFCSTVTEVSFCAKTLAHKLCRFHLYLLSIFYCSYKALIITFLFI